MRDLMKKYISLRNFCPQDKFRQKVIEILCNNLFSKNSIALDCIYQKMAKNINVPYCRRIYSLEGKFLSNKICLKKIKKINNPYAGHDLPVWLNDPFNSSKRIMILSQDPRRNDSEMKDTKMKDNVIGISTPFGVHSMVWRSHKSHGMPLYLAEELINCSDRNISVYFTDTYKLRGVGPKSVVDTCNKDVYKNILYEEIKLFNPDIILAIGKHAHQAITSMASCITSKAHIINVPHPNARPKTWQNKYPSITNYSTEEKLRYVLKDIFPYL